MPNWTDNDLYVHGPKGEVARMVAEAFTDYKGTKAPDFGKIVPYPTQFAEHDKKIEELTKKAPANPEAAKRFWMKQGFEHGYPKDGYNAGGYDWCIANWGTKWDACEPRDYELTSKGEKSTLKVRFDTAWAPPRPIIMALSKRFPTLTITMKSFECGMGFKCHLRVRGGVVAVDKSENYSGHRGG